MIEERSEAFEEIFSMLVALRRKTLKPKDCEELCVLLDNLKNPGQVINTVHERQLALFDLKEVA